MRVFIRRAGAAAMAMLLALAAATPVRAEDPAQPIVKCMKANVPEQLQVREFELTSTDKTGGTRTMIGRLHARLENGKINAMMRISAPSDLRDAAYLVRESDEPGQDEEMYVYIPALQKVRRVTEEMRKQLKRRLRVAGIDEGKLDALANQIVDLLKVRRGQ